MMNILYIWFKALGKYTSSFIGKLQQKCHNEGSMEGIAFSFTSENTESLSFKGYATF